MQRCHGNKTGESEGRTEELVLGIGQRVEQHGYHGNYRRYDCRLCGIVGHSARDCPDDRETESEREAESERETESGRETESDTSDESSVEDVHEAAVTAPIRKWDESSESETDSVVWYDSNSGDEDTDDEVFYESDDGSHYFNSDIGSEDDQVTSLIYLFDALSN